MDASSYKNRFNELIAAAPTATAIYHTSDIIITAANAAMIDFWKKDEGVIGKPLIVAIPELLGQPFITQLENVFRTGETFHAEQQPANLLVNGELETFYFNYTYKAILNIDGSTEAIIHSAIDVTPLIRSRQELAETQERLSIALESAEIGTWDLDPINNLVYLDQRCRELFGFEGSDKIPYDQVLDGIHPQDKSKVRDAVAAAIDPTKLNTYDVRFRTVGNQSGKIRWLHCKGRAYFNSEGIAYRFAGTARDINSEINTSVSEQQLMALVNYNADHMSIADMSGNLIYMNEAGKRLLGVPIDADINQMSAADFYEPEELERVQQTIIPEIDSENGWSGILNFIHYESKETIPCQVNYMLIKNPISGELIGRGATSRDLRPEFKARAELQRLATIVEISEDFCNYTDLNGNTIYINAAGQKLIGIDPNHIAKTNIGSYHSAESAELISGSIMTHLLKMGKWSGRLDLKHLETAELIPIHKQLFIIRDQLTGEPIAIAGIARDLRAEIMAAKQKDNFLSVASHELKTPVTAIKAYAQVLETLLKRSGDERNAVLMGKMDKQVDRLSSLISDLLDVTKINSGRLQLNNNTFDFNEMVSETLQELQFSADRHEIQAKLEFAGTINGDRDRINQVVVNLITNAIKYSPEADRIIVRTKNHNAEVLFYVQDFGIGLNPDKQELVFEQFYRVSGTKEHTFSGLGLGLYISSEIVKQIGGKIWVKSELGKGSTFYVAIPITAPSDKN